MSLRRRALPAACLLALIAATLLFLSRGSLPSRDDDDSRSRLREPPSPSEPPTLAPSPSPRVGRSDRDEAAPIAGESSSPPAGTVVVLGRVVSEDRAPVAGAEVLAAVSGVPPVSGRSDAEGRFRLVVAGANQPPHRLAVRAAKDGRAASRGFSPTDGSARRFAAGDLVLRAAAELVIRVVDHGTSVAGARVLASSRRPTERLLDPLGAADAPWLGWPFETTTDAKGIATLPSLPLGDVRVAALAPGPRRGEIHLAHDARSERTLEVLSARDVVVEIVEHGTGTPVAGVRVGVETTSEILHGEVLVDEPLPTSPTDAAGRTTLPSLPRGVPFTLTVVGDGWIWPAWRSGFPLRADADRVRLEVPAATARVRAPATFLDGASPPDGTAVTLEPRPEDERGFWGPAGLPVSSARIEDGALVIEGLRNDQISAIARLPDGRIARFVVDHHMGDVPPVFHRPRAINVRVVEADGTPVPDAVVAVTLEGRTRTRVRVERRVRTGSDGRVRVEDLSPGRATVTVDANSDLVEEARRGVFADESREHVDLSAGDGDVTFTLPAWVGARLEVADGGRPAFPPGTDVVVGMHPSSIAYVDPPAAIWDAKAASVSFRLRRPTGSRVLKALVTAPGRATVWVDFHADESGETWVGRAEMGAAGSVVATVLSAGVRDLARLLERRGEDGVWGPVWSTRRAREDARDVRLRVDDVPVGTCRLRDADWTGAVSDAVAVRAGETATLTLDLSHAAQVEVTVTLPDGVDATRLRILRSGAGIDLPDAATRAWVEGTETWSWWIPGDRPVRIRAEHPDCDAKPGVGDVTVTDPGPKLSLRLDRKPR